MKKEQLTLLKDDAYKIILKVPAQRNAANVRVRELIAEEYGVTQKAVRIVTGHHHPSKILEVIKKEV